MSIPFNDDGRCWEHSPHSLRRCNRPRGHSGDHEVAGEFAHVWAPAAALVERATPLETFCAAGTHVADAGYPCPECAKEPEPPAVADRATADKPLAQLIRDVQAMRVYCGLLRPFDVELNGDEICEIASDNKAEILARLSHLEAALRSLRSDREREAEQP